MARRLRRGCEDERLSLDTFAERVERAFRAPSRVELHELVADLPPGRLARLVDRVKRLREPAPEKLALPGTAGTFVFGRSRTSDCVLADPSVSRTHAWLRHGARGWWLRDLASSNGTWVNGRRVVEEVEVRPGDRVSFGGVTYRLTPPAGSGRRSPIPSMLPSLSRNQAARSPLDFLLG